MKTGSFFLRWSDKILEMEFSFVEGELRHFLACFFSATLDVCVTHVTLKKLYNHTHCKRIPSQTQYLLVVLPGNPIIAGKEPSKEKSYSSRLPSLSVDHDHPRFFGKSRQHPLNEVFRNRPSGWRSKGFASLKHYNSDLSSRLMQVVKYRVGLHRSDRLNFSAAVLRGNSGCS